MARTPLLSSLRRLFAEQRVARELGLPVDLVRERRREHALRRRALLAGAAASAGAFALPRVGAAAPNKGARVAVVGAGIAGLSCALELRDRGVDVTVYEASARVGGRMFTNASTWDAGQVSEWGGELIDTGHKTVRALAKRYDLPLDDLLAAEDPGAEETYHFFDGYYPKADAEADFAQIYDVVRADLAAAPFPTRYDAYTAAGLALDNTSIHEWIESRVPGGHGSPLGALLDVAYAIEFGADTRDQSSLNLLYLLAYQPTPNSFQAFGISDERYHIRGGNQRLPEAIAADLGERVVTGHKLVRLAARAGGDYLLGFERGGQTIEHGYPWVVLCVPFAVLRGVDTRDAGFDDLKQRAIDELGGGRNGKLQLQFDARAWRGTGAWPGVGNGSSYADIGYQASWEVTRAQPGVPGILVLYSGGSVSAAMKTKAPFATEASASVRQDARDGLAQIAPVYPGLSWNGRATQSLPHLSPLAGASYSYYRVGQYTTFCGYEMARQGGVLFAGEHTSIDFQGYMEGGAEQGVRAAKDLLALI